MELKEKVYLYDGTFQGLLAAIFNVFDDKRKERFRLADICPESGWQSLLDTGTEIIRVDSSQAKWERVEKGIIQKMGRDALNLVYMSYLSETERCGVFIYEYLELGFKVGRNINSHLADERVMKIFELNRKVSNENHRMYGFVRFKDIGYGVLYSEIEPDNNILEMLMMYFCDRMPSQRFVIADLKRKKYGIYDTRNIYFTDEIPDTINKVKDVDKDYEKLWKKFFHAIEIDERSSIKRQMLHMPKKYWKHIIEKI